MLIEFSVKNFRSIKDRVTLSMVAAEGDELEENLTPPLRSGGDRLLKSAVIYGANASGKSNVLEALKFMVRFVRNDFELERGEDIPIDRFRLDFETLSEPSEFEVFFIYKGIEYQYGFSVSNSKVIDEYLYSYPNDTETLVFERKNTVNYQFQEDVEEQKILSKRTLENTSYLWSSTQWNNKQTLVAYDWFRQQFEEVSSQVAMSLHTAALMANDPVFHQKVVEFLKNADTGICDVEILKVPVPNFDDSNKGPKIFWYTANTIRNFTDSNGVDSSVHFDMREESEGTQRIFNLLGFFLEVLIKGQVFIIDELESSLHPLLTEKLIQLFHDPKTNPNNAQLIFTTHNTNLLDTDKFRRDQIWFTEKNPDTGSTDLYSLNDFQPISNEDVEKGYLNGRYGAIPFFGGSPIV